MYIEIKNACQVLVANEFDMVLLMLSSSDVKSHKHLSLIWLQEEHELSSSGSVSHCSCLS